MPPSEIGATIAAPSSQPTDLIQSLQRGLRVLDFVAEAGEPVAPKQIAAGLGLALGTTYHLINTLLHEGWLERGPDRRLVVGSPPARLARAGAGVPVGVERVLGRAAYAVDDVALMTRLVGGEAVVAAAVEVPGAACAGRYPASSRHLPHLSAAGRAMLALQPAGAARQTVDLVRAAAVRAGELFDEAGLAEELEAVRRTGLAVAVADGEACVGAPVQAADGGLLGAVAAVITPRRLRADLDGTARAVRCAARDLARELTWLPAGDGAQSSGSWGVGKLPPSISSIR